MTASGWSLGEAEARRIEEILHEFLRQSGVASALLIDHTGQTVTGVGASLPDRDGLASLAAADYSANDQLASLIGDVALGPIVHQGERGSVLLADVARRVILLAVFDRRTTP
ncbi:MAG: roadblock/LC7 domain-containing protein, partial [Gemmatimonadota bacterium]